MGGSGNHTPRLSRRPALAAHRLAFEGRHWPRTAETMVGLKRLRNIRECVEQVLEDQIPGDLIETGVWRGGSCIYMRAILAAHEIGDRTVWVADSFEGLPPPTLPQDEGLNFNESPELAVGVDEVRANFERYGLLDDQVRFLIGWFADTLPGPVRQLAVLRLDGDLYESTWDAMTALEPLVSPGGFVIVDDYGVYRSVPQGGARLSDPKRDHVPHRADRRFRGLLAQGVDGKRPLTVVLFARKPTTAGHSGDRPQAVRERGPPAFHRRYEAPRSDTPDSLRQLRIASRRALEPRKPAPVRRMMRELNALGDVW